MDMLHLDLSAHGRIVPGLVIGGAPAAPLRGWADPDHAAKAAPGLVAMVVSAQAMISLYGFLRA